MMGVEYARAHLQYDRLRYCRHVRWQCEGGSWRKVYV